MAIAVSHRFSPSGDLPVEAGRYRLVASGACPWCRRVLIARRLLGLTEAIPVSWSYGKGADGYWELTGPEGEPGVDPALVSYYFGSKGDLFGAAMNMRIRAAEEIAAVLAGDLRSAGPRLVRLAMTAWDDSEGGATFHALLRWIATDDSAPEAVQAYATKQIAGPITQALAQVGVSVPHARERATLVGSQVVGLAMIRYLLRLEPLASASVDHLVEVIGPTVQHYLTEPLIPPQSRHR